MKRYDEYEMLSVISEVYRNRARVLLPKFDQLTDEERKQETERLLTEIRVLVDERKRYGSTDTELLDQKMSILIALNLGLIYLSMKKVGCFCSRRGRRGSNELVDYFNAGTSRMTFCAENYDPARGTFSTYVVKSITGGSRGMKSNEMTVFGSARAGNDMAAILDAENELAIAGKAATSQAIYECVHRKHPNTKLSVAKIDDILTGRWKGMHPGGKL